MIDTGRGLESVSLIYMVFKADLPLSGSTWYLNTLGTSGNFPRALRQKLDQV